MRRTAPRDSSVSVNEARRIGIEVDRSGKRWPLVVDNRSSKTIWFCEERPPKGERFLLYTRIPRDVNPSCFVRVEPGGGVSMTW